MDIGSESSATQIPSSGSPLSRRRALAIGLGGVAAVAVASPAWAVTDQRPGATRPPTLNPSDRAIAAQVSASRALKHLRVLSEGIGPRIGGTASERAAADYLADVLDDLGYRTTLQPFPVADKFLAQLSSSPGLPDDLNWQVAASPHAALNTKVSGPVVDVRAGAVADYPADVTGKVVLVDYVLAQREALVATAVAREQRPWSSSRPTWWRPGAPRPSRRTCPARPPRRCRSRWSGWPRRRSTGSGSASPPSRSP